MHKKIFVMLISCVFTGASCFAAPPMPGYDTQPSVEEAAGGGVYMGSPAYPPMYLSNGAVNLDDVWTEDGGARMYWNSTRYPIQLKLAGQTWVDPALVPELFTQKASVVKKRYRPRRKARAKPNVICFPADQVPEALRPKPKTQLTAKAKEPATPVAVKEEAPAPAAPTPPPLEAPLEENTSIPAPRLQ